MKSILLITALLSGSAFAEWVVQPQPVIPYQAPTTTNFYGNNWQTGNSFTGQFNGNTGYMNFRDGSTYRFDSLSNGSIVVTPPQPVGSSFGGPKYDLR